MNNGCQSAENDKVVAEVEGIGTGASGLILQTWLFSFLLMSNVPDVILGVYLSFVVYGK